MGVSPQQNRRSTCISSLTSTVEALIERPLKGDLDSMRLTERIHYVPFPPLDGLFDGFKDHSERLSDDAVFATSSIQWKILSDLVWPAIVDCIEKKFLSQYASRENLLISIGVVSLGDEIRIPPEDHEIKFTTSTRSWREKLRDLVHIGTNTVEKLWQRYSAKPVQTVLAGGTFSSQDFPYTMASSIAAQGRTYPGVFLSKGFHKRARVVEEAERERVFPAIIVYSENGLVKNAGGDYWRLPKSPEERQKTVSGVIVTDALASVFEFRKQLKALGFK